MEQGQECIIKQPSETGKVKAKKKERQKTDIRLWVAKIFKWSGCSLNLSARWVKWWCQAWGIHSCSPVGSDLTTMLFIDFKYTIPIMLCQCGKEQRVWGPYIDNVCFISEQVNHISLFWHSENNQLETLIVTDTIENTLLNSCMKVWRDRLNQECYHRDKIRHRPKLTTTTFSEKKINLSFPRLK